MFMLLALCPHKSHIWENLGSGFMNQNTLGQSDFRVLKYISEIKIDESSWFLGFRYRFKRCKRYRSKILSANQIAAFAYQW